MGDGVTTYRVLYLGRVKTTGNLEAEIYRGRLRVILEYFSTQEGESYCTLYVYTMDQLTSAFSSAYLLVQRNLLCSNMLHLFGNNLTFINSKHNHTNSNLTYNWRTQSNK